MFVLMKSIINVKVTKGSKLPMKAEDDFTLNFDRENIEIGEKITILIPVSCGGQLKPSRRDD